MSKRIQTREQAADELGMKLGMFDDWVRKGILPAPIPGTKRWDRDAIKAKLDKASDLEQSNVSEYDKWLGEQYEDQRQAC